MDRTELSERLDAFPGIAELRSATVGEPAFLVGGGVRDLLLGAERADLDVVVEGDAIAIARAIGDEVAVHERFGTATVHLGDLSIDLTGARTETYPSPGALPDVRPGRLTDDLARRDFTINAMALALEGEPELIDPHGGEADLAAGTIRVLHPRSFIDDPTRALRAARYAARFDFSLDPATEELVRATDLSTVSADRVESELRKLAAEANPARGLELAARWGVVPLGADAIALIDSVHALLASPPWQGLAGLEDVTVAVAAGRLVRAGELASGEPTAPSAAVERAHGHGGVDLVLARAMGAAWLDRYVAEWRHTRLEIDGADLLEAGIGEGPAIGRGLGAALRAKLDGEISDRESELRVALDAAGAN